MPRHRSRDAERDRTITGHNPIRPAHHFARLLHDPGQTRLGRHRRDGPTASLTMTSDQGDYIGDGREYSCDTSAGDVFGSSSTEHRVNIDLRAAIGDWWHLDFAAPAGQALAPRTSDFATRLAVQGPGASGLSVSGNGRGCNTLTGSFTVTEATFDPFGNVERFAADFEQHCEGAQPALRGRVRLVNPPAPEPLSIGLGLSATGALDRVSGSATVGGTLTCTRPTGVYLSGTLAQRARAASSS